MSLGAELHRQDVASLDRSKEMKFVWIKDAGRLRPELWADDAPFGCTIRRVVAASHDLTPQEAKMTLAELSKSYPAPEAADAD